MRVCAYSVSVSSGLTRKKNNQQEFLTCAKGVRSGQRFETSLEKRHHTDQKVRKILNDHTVVLPQ